MRAWLPTVIVLAAVSWASWAVAGTHASVPAGGGLPALDVKVDLAAAVVRANSVEVPMGLEPSLLADEVQVVGEAVSLGAKRSLIHVRVPERGSDSSGPAW